MRAFEAGDIAACYGTDRASRLVRIGTFNPLAPRGLKRAPSHVAIFALHGRYDVLWTESTTLTKSPCILNGHVVSGCQAHLPVDRLAEYCSAGGHVDLYRLTRINELSTLESRLLSTILFRHFVGRRVQYDLTGALVSGTRALKYLPWRIYDDTTLFCSELIAAVLMRLCRLPRGNPSTYSPASLVRTLVRHGTYRRERQIRYTNGVTSA